MRDYFENVVIQEVDTENFRKKSGQNIVKLRTQKGWSQSDLARACKKDRQAIEKLENGKVNATVYTLLEVAEALDVSLSRLVEV